jgi:hypothetical protein
MTPVNLFTSFSTFGAKYGGELPAMDLEGDVLEDDTSHHRTCLQVPVPLEPRTAVSSPPWTSRETSLRMTPVLTEPTSFCKHVPGSTLKNTENFNLIHILHKVLYFVF